MGYMALMDMGLDIGDIGRYWRLRSEQNKI